MLMPAGTNDTWLMVHMAHGSADERQELVGETLRVIDFAREVFEARGLSRASADLGDLPDALLCELGMSRTLSSVGVGEDKHDHIARNSLEVFVEDKPVPVREQGSVLEMLQMCKHTRMSGMANMIVYALP